MYREVLEKKLGVICISKDRESVSHLSPSFHLLASTDPECPWEDEGAEWQVHPDRLWPSGVHQGTSSHPLLNRTASDCGRQHKPCQFSLIKEVFTSSMSYLRLHLYPFHWLGVLGKQRNPLCSTSSLTSPVLWCGCFPLIFFPGPSHSVELLC